MSFKQYNRISERNAARNLINFHFNEVAEEELDNKASNELWNQGVEEYYERVGQREEKKSEFALDYLEQNSPAECKSCDSSRCYLQKDFYECGKIGIKIEELSNILDDFQIFKTKEIPKYRWVDVGDCLIKV